MATKQIVTLVKRSINLCEINKEYPSLVQSSTPRHLCTSIQSVSIPIPLNINNLSNKLTTEHQDKNINKHSKQLKEDFDIINLYQYKQDEEINNKLYRKCRNRINDDDRQRDNKD